MKRLQTTAKDPLFFHMVVGACCLVAALTPLAVGSTVTELKPLPGYTASSAADINEDGNVVGTCSEPASSWAPPSRATLWVLGGTPVYLSKSPGFDSTDWQSTEAICINKGERSSVRGAWPRRHDVLHLEE
ncbi:MAG: hypothetical protein L0Y44_00795 [Phycisphaerales bacterium]|nr:hypothetical protein [Phycisphaerales bacterium]MCI0629175.1 hypothetical protein [Phycisphaerales bacterium]MCI0675715.1 hypothetical protein [Phycisphaerales bacterium]